MGLAEFEVWGKTKSGNIFCCLTSCGFEFFPGLEIPLYFIHMISTSPSFPLSEQNICITRFKLHSSNRTLYLRCRKLLLNVLLMSLTMKNIKSTQRDIEKFSECQVHTYNKWHTRLLNNYLFNCILFKFLFALSNLASYRIDGLKTWL